MLQPKASRSDDRRYEEPSQSWTLNFIQHRRKQKVFGWDYTAMYQSSGREAESLLFQIELGDMAEMNIKQRILFFLFKQRLEKPIFFNITSPVSSRPYDLKPGQKMHFTIFPTSSNQDHLDYAITTESKSKSDLVFLLGLHCQYRWHVLVRVIILPSPEVPEGTTVWRKEN